MNKTSLKCIAGGLLISAVSGAASADDRFWNNPAGGQFGAAENWDAGGGTVPGVEDAAIFDLDATYLVDFLEDQTTDRMLVRRGVVTFGTTKGAAAHYTLLNPLASTPSIAVGEDMTASLVLGTSVVLSGEGVALGIGVSGMGTLTLTDAELRLDQYIHLGLEGTGALVASDGASIESTGSALGLLPGATGTAALTGLGTAWDCAGPLVVGEQGTGSLFIDGGADVTSDGGIVGQQVGSLGDVTISGLGSSWLVFDSLDVGMRGTGTMTVSDGATLFNLGFATIGSFPAEVGEGGLGIVRVDGTSTSWSVQGDLWVGFLASGTLILSRGGQVDMDGNLFRALGGATARMIIELGGPLDYIAPALLSGGFSDGFEPRVKFVDGYVPENGDRFEIVQAAGGVGPFVFDLPELPEDLAWHLIVDPDRVAIEVATPCVAFDIDGSGQIDFPDILAILSAWGECPGCEVDIDRSGAADFGDVLLILSLWGSCP